MTGSEQEFDRLPSDSGYHEVADWTVLQLSGEDRVKFLQSFCTADINAMAPLEVREAFILNGKGKTLGHVHVLMLLDALLLVGAGGQSVALMEHLDMYIIRDDVQIKDLSNSMRSFLLTGKRAADGLADLFGTAPEQGMCQTVGVEGGECHAAFAEFAGDCFWLGVPKLAVKDWVSHLAGAGFAPLSVETLAMCRLAKGTPWFGVETTADNLPQELNRDEKTISFTKGCYLGQETVARIDSLGRVNRLLVVLDFLNEEPLVGQELVMDGKPVGRVTSVGRSLNGVGWRALAFVKRDFASVGSIIGHGVVAPLQEPSGS
ncbi:MAG: hypothetical protein MK106_13460 [Mariniblastus sp.]|nr:hypothetical protein [Mariniblastus sp.]